MDFLRDLAPDAGPVYQQIAEHLRAAIDSGRLEPGARVPGENDLIKRYGVARVTAREALGVLRNSGLVETVPKVGTFVRRFQPVYRYGSRRLRTERWTSGGTIQTAELGGRAHTTEVLFVGATAADERLSSLLEIRPGASVLRRSRRYRVEGKPVQLATSHLPGEIADGTPIAEPDPGPGGVYGRLREMGLSPERWVEELAVRMPTPEESRLLDLPTGNPVVTITRVAFTADDRPIEINDMTFDGTAYVFVYDLIND
ncbi:GntR family transcriptional regulator [Krasilnikovia sp. MM14-A1004]|uniref:GntR family transcriptional regulator n=1 Tax=Krasilnikovia sp. MM14-A1004 TaxID=3373541 RepID=UPI00399D39E3